MSETTRGSLAGSFGAPAAARKEERDRAAGLSGLLPGRATRPAPADAPSKPKPAAESTEPVEVAAPAPAAPAKAEKPVATKVEKPSAPQAPAAAPVKLSDTTVRTKPVYVAPALLEQVRTEGKARDLTYTDLLVESFEIVDEKQLRDAFVQERPATSSMPARVRARRGTGGIQVNLRLDGAQERWLDEKVDAVGAPSRSALVSTVFALRFANEGSGKRGSGDA